MNNIDPETSLENHINNTENHVVEVSGIVLDAATKKPLAGVRVQPYNNRRFSALTNENGEFTIKVPDYTTSLGFSLESYNYSQRSISSAKADDQSLTVMMYPDDFRNTYSDKSGSGVSYSSKVDNKNQNLTIENHIQNVEGSSVRAVSHSALPGNGMAMFMFGLNSLHASSQPLYVIDGVLMDFQNNSSMLHDGYYNNLLSNINVDDIENVTVLKNGTSLYGARGANGVILVNTKRNSSMATLINVNISGGFERVPKLPSMMNASQYKNYASELIGTTETKLTDFKFLQHDPNYYYYKYYNNETDWTDLTYRNAFTQNYGINVQGGDDIANYHLSVGYTNSNSTLEANDFTRFNIRLNSDINLSRKFTARFDASFSDVMRDLRDDGVMESFDYSTVTSTGFLSLIKSPFLSPYAYNTNGELSSFLSQADDYLDEAIGREVSLANPRSIIEYGNAKNKNTFLNRYINIAITPKYQFNENLSVYEHFSYNLVNISENYYLPITGVPQYEVEGLGWVNNQVSSMSARQNYLYSDTRVEWDKRYNANHISLFGGLRFINNKFKQDLQSGYNTGNDKTPNMSAGLAYKSTGGKEDEYRMFTYYLSADYNFRERYYLSGGVSMEASSRFGDKVKNGVNMFKTVWAFFPSAQASWVASSESWFPKTDMFSYLKIYAGYDKSGNDDINYSASRTFFSAKKILDAIGSLSLGNVGNNKLQWETTQRGSIGLDANFVNDRLNLKANIYKSWTDHLLTLKTLSFVSGLKQNWSNDGSLENKGYEVQLNAKVINFKDFKWEVGAGIAGYKNKIKSLPDNNSSFITSAYGAEIITQINSPAGLFYGYKTKGVLATSEQARNASAHAIGQSTYDSNGLYQVNKTGKREYFEAGDMLFADINNDGIIDDKDKVVIGDPNPDFYGNIYTNLTYKRFRLNAIFSYCYGNDIYNYQRSILESGNRFFNQTVTMMNRWRVEGQETDIPRLTYEDPMGNARFSDRWIEDGSFLKLKTVNLSYSLPINSQYLNGFTVWVAANNLFTISKYCGSDPETSVSNSVLYQGIDRGLLAPGRSFVLGININL